jgi:membrane-bound lytic murein transglycosylase F
MGLRAHHIGAAAPLLALLAAALVGIQRSAPRGGDAAPAPPFAATAPAPASSAARIAVEDLSGIRFRREFRVLVPQRSTDADRHATPSAHQSEAMALIEQFAEEQFLIPVTVSVPRWEDLVPALLAGRGDVIGASMRIREYRSRDVAFSVPVTSLREVLVTRAADRVQRPRDLRGREIALRERSSFWPELHRLRHLVGDINARIVPDTLPTDAMLQRVLSGQYDMAVLDPGGARIGASRWQALAVSPAFTSSANLSFGVHPEAVELRNALDDFLTREQLIRRELPRRTDDLPGIARSGVLRVLTRNNAGSYFIWRGRPLGFEYELIGKFADEQNLSLEMIVADGRDRLLPALVHGEGDIVAAGLVPTPERLAAGVAFTRPYKESYEQVITRADDTSLIGASDLAGRTVHLRRSSPVWQLIEALREQGLDIRLEAAPEELETEEIIARVAGGNYDVTVADAYSVKVALTWRDDVRAAFALDGPMPVAWAVREENQELLAALNAFLDREHKQLFYNIIHARYFENPRRIRAHVSQRMDTPDGTNALSPFDELARKAAEKHGFDWPLIVAMMYRESRFDPDVVSWAGARGLMQVLPTTAQRFGISDPDTPQGSILAGVRMLGWLYQQLESELPVPDRTWFSLAAYNAGLGHLLDARRLAREQGLDPNRWFDNVEKAMLLLSRPEHYRNARHGYVRGVEPVTYVRDIRKLYNAYRSMLAP